MCCTYDTALPNGLSRGIGTCRVYKAQPTGLSQAFPPLPTIKSEIANNITSPSYNKVIDCKSTLTLLHSELPKLHRVLAVLSAIGLITKVSTFYHTRDDSLVTGTYMFQIFVYLIQPECMLFKVLNYSETEAVLRRDWNFFLLSFTFFFNPLALRKAKIVRFWSF